MARASAVVQCDSMSTYMDGVHVKIAEGYKPPRKITLPAAYHNKYPDVSRYGYDFSREKSVLNKMTEWRKAREARVQERETRLKEIKQWEEAHVPPPPPPLPSDTVKPLPIKVAPAPKTTILTPQLLSHPVYNGETHVKTNRLDYADFDNDTSSPFDNMALKTINDMEELAQVLQPNASQWLQSTKLDNIINDLTIDNEAKDQIIEKDVPVDNQANKANGEQKKEKTTDVNQEIVLVIVQELQKELQQPIKENWRPWPDLESPDWEKRLSSVENSSTAESLESTKVLSDLSENDQKLALRLCDMGFPLLRVTRAIRDLEGEEKKKIVEYLLAVQSLEDLGMPEDDAVKALALTQYDKQKAKMYHESLCTLRDLGFPEDKASLALLKSNIDRDRALDLLIA